MSTFPRVIFTAAGDMKGPGRCDRGTLAAGMVRRMHLAEMKGSADCDCVLGPVQYVVSTK